jgi:hypothetical protein
VTTGWTRASWSAFYLGTATHTTTYGASLARTVSGQRFYLVATRCPTCGTASVYLGGRYISAVNLHASTTQRQTVSQAASSFPRDDAEFFEHWSTAPNRSPPERTLVCHHSGP